MKHKASDHSTLSPDTFSALYRGKCLASYIMPAPCALCFIEEGDNWNYFFYLAFSAVSWRDWDGPNKVPSKRSEGFDESTSSSSWINRAVAFTCSEEEKKLFLELVISSWRRAWAQRMAWTEVKSLHMTCGFTVWLLMLWFQGTWCFVSQWYYLCLWFFYPYEPSGYCWY